MNIILMSLLIGVVSLKESFGTHVSGEEEQILLLQDIVRKIDNVTQEFTELHDKVDELEVKLNKKMDALAIHYISALEQKMSYLEESVSAKVTSFATTTFKEVQHIMDKNFKVVCSEEGYEMIGGRCLHFMTVGKSYQESLEDCQEIGGQLLKLDNEDLWNEVVHYIEDHGHKDTNYWVGMDDRNFEGKFRYLDGELVPLALPMWLKGQPDNLYGREHCVHMRFRSNYQLNDQNCSNKMMAICEYVDNNLYEFHY